MKKLSLFMASLMVICVLASCVGSNINNDIIGEWHLAQKSENVSQRDYYPEARTLIFNADGSWSDGKPNHDKNNTYSISGDTLTMDSDRWVYPATYTVAIVNGELMIQFSGEEPLYFEKAD